MFTARFEYESGIDDDDGEFISDSPRIFIVGPDGYDFLEVLLEPTALIVKPKDDDAHWQMPQEVYGLVGLLNESYAPATDQP